MKNFILLLSIIFLTLSVQGQPVDTNVSGNSGFDISTSVTSNGTCSQIGAITMSLATSNTVFYSPPFDIDLEYTNQGTETYHTMNSSSITFSDLLPGVYNITVYYSETCSEVFTVPLEYSTETLTTGYKEFKHICNNEPGHIKLDQWQGNNGDVTFSWTRDGSPYAGNQRSITIDIAGEYCATISDQGGCSIEECFTIYNFDDIIVSSVNNLSLCGSDAINDGSIEINFNRPEGIDLISFNWTGPEGYESNSLSIENLAIGDYIFHATFEDKNRDFLCTVERTFKVMPYQIDTELEEQSHICNSETGKIRVADWEDSQGSVTISWTRNGVFYIGNQRTILPTEGGEYCAILTDEEGCMGTKCFTIINFDGAINIEADNQIDCDLQNGTISTQISGIEGYNFENYSWTGPNGFESSELSLQNLNAGEYTFTGSFVNLITDETECVVTKKVVLNCSSDPPSNSGCQVTVVISPAGVNNIVGFVLKAENVGGIVNAIIKNGNQTVGTFFINLSPLLTSQKFKHDVSGLDPGDYTVEFTNNNTLCSSHPFKKHGPPPTSCIEICKFTDTPLGDLETGFISFCKEGDECIPIEYYIDDPGTIVPNCDFNCLPTPPSGLIDPNGGCHERFINSEILKVFNSSDLFNVYTIEERSHVVNRKIVNETKNGFLSEYVTQVLDYEKLYSVFSSSIGIICFFKETNKFSLAVMDNLEKRYSNYENYILNDVSQNDLGYKVIAKALHSDSYSELQLNELGQLISETILNFSTVQNILKVQFLNDGRYSILSEDGFGNTQYASSFGDEIVESWSLPVGFEFETSFKSTHEYFIGGYVENVVDINEVSYGMPHRYTPIVLSFDLNGALQTIQTKQFSGSNNLSDLMIEDNQFVGIIGENWEVDQTELSASPCVFISTLDEEDNASFRVKEVEMSIQITPSPFSNNFNISIFSKVTSKAHIQIFSRLGEQIYSEKSSINKGSNYLNALSD